MGGQLLPPGNPSSVDPRQDKWIELRAGFDRCFAELEYRDEKLLVAVTVATSAFGQTGPVAALCTQDIQTCCANKGHGSRQTRLEANRGKLSAERQ